jgi:hypothetical protein
MHGILPMCRTWPTDVTSPTVDRSHGAQWNSGPDRELKLELLLRVKQTSAGLANANLACIQRKNIGLTKL